MRRPPDPKMCSIITKPFVRCPIHRGRETPFLRPWRSASLHTALPHPRNSKHIAPAVATGCHRHGDGDRVEGVRAKGNVTGYKEARHIHVHEVWWNFLMNGNLGRPCLQTTNRNSHGQRVNGRGIRVNGVAFGVKCAYSCILGAFGPTQGAWRPTKGSSGPPGGRGQSSHIPFRYKHMAYLY